MEMVHDHREEILIEAAEEANSPEDIDDLGVELDEVNNSNRDGDLNEGQTEVTPPPTQEAAITEPEIKVEDDTHEASDDEMENEPEDNELRSTTLDNDGHRTDSISITDSMEDDANGGMDEEGVNKETYHDS